MVHPLGSDTCPWVDGQQSGGSGTLGNGLDTLQVTYVTEGWRRHWCLLGDIYDDIILLLLLFLMCRSISVVVVVIGQWGAGHLCSSPVTICLTITR